MSHSFEELIENICKRPRMYTLSGSFDEVIAFLDGYVIGRREFDPELGVKWDRFTGWLSDRLRAR